MKSSIITLSGFIGFLSWSYLLNNGPVRPESVLAILLVSIIGGLELFQLFQQQFGLNIGQHRLLDQIKFFGHIMLIIFEIYVVANILTILYNLIFYFGFISTLIIGVGILLCMSIKNDIIEALNENPVGKIILGCCNFCYDRYFYISSCVNTVLSYLFGYLSFCCKYIYDAIIDINIDLASNTKSQLLKQRFFATGMKFAMPIFMDYMKRKMFEGPPANLGNMPNPNPNTNPFTKIFGANSTTANPSGLILKQRTPDASLFGANSTTANPSGLIPKPVNPTNISSNTYKNIPTSNNNDMSFLNNTTFAEDDIIDDDLDDCLNDCLDEIEKKFEKSDGVDKLSSTTPTIITENTRTPEETRLAYKKKLNEKTLARTGRKKNTQQMNKRNNSKQANQPSPTEINKLMETIMQGNNLETLMKEFPLDQSGQPNMNNINPEKIKQMMNSMTKK